MTSLAARFGQWNTVQVFKRTVETLFSKHLLVTNTTITVSLSMTGDVLQQQYEVLCGRQKFWDRGRTMRVCGTALFIGPTCHYWYLFLDRFLPGRAIKTVAKKILIDQVVFSPVNISMFLVLLGLFEGSSKKQIVHELKTDFFQILKAEWIIWPPAQLVNFYFLPTRYRVLYDNTVSLGFDYYYSYVKYRKDKPKLTDDNDNDTKDDCDEPIIAKDYYVQSEKFQYDDANLSQIVRHTDHCYSNSVYRPLW